VAIRCSSQETTRGGGDDVAASFLPRTVDPTPSTGVFAQHLAVSPAILDQNVLRSTEQAASVAAATPDRKRGKSMSRRSGQAGTVVKKGKDVVRQILRRYSGPRSTQVSVRAAGTNEDADRQQIANDLGALEGVSPLILSVIPPNPPKSERVALRGDAA
jgi:hypothetical protein